MVIQLPVHAETAEYKFKNILCTIMQKTQLLLHTQTHALMTMNKRSVLHFLHKPQSKANTVHDN